MDTRTRLVEEFYNGTAEKDWPAWAIEAVEAIESLPELDSIRYRWLRQVIGPGEKTAEWLLLTAMAKYAPDTPEGFDSAVDAAMHELPLGGSA